MDLLRFWSCLVFTLPSFSTIVPSCCRWRTVEQTPTVPNSSSRLPQRPTWTANTWFLERFSGARVRCGRSREQGAKRTSLLRYARGCRSDGRMSGALSGRAPSPVLFPAGRGKLTSRGCLGEFRVCFTSRRNILSNPRQYLTRFFRLELLGGRLWGDGILTRPS